jgi:hypothetical protein
VKRLRLYPALLFLIGAIALLVAVACGGGEKQAPAATASPTEVATNTATPTGTNSPTPSPTATPTPYNGAVARLKMPRFNVDAPIEDLAINANNEMETPKGVNTHVGWYYVYDKPGRLPGWHELQGERHLLRSRLLPQQPRPVRQPRQVRPRR